MAVLEHDIHPSTQHGAEFRYGCNGLDRARRPYIVKAGFDIPIFDFMVKPINYFSRKLLWKSIPDTGSLECRYDLSLKDHGCTDCQHRGSGEAYDQMVRNHGS